MCFLGRDTRPSSTPLLEALKYLLIFFNIFLRVGVESVGCQTKVFDETTTPQLHYFVKHFNEESHHFTRDTAPTFIFKSYFKNLGGAFTQFMEAIGYKKNSNKKIILDCSNGVGGSFVSEILGYTNPYFDVTPINTKDI